MTGKDRYQQAVTKARLQATRDLSAFVADEIDVLPDQGERERECIIAEMDVMQREIDRQHEILEAAGLTGAAGEAMRPLRQGKGEGIVLNDVGCSCLVRNTSAQANPLALASVV